MEAKTEGEEKKEIEEDDLIDNDRLEAILNRFDERTQLQEMLHNYMSDGFMSLARERYRDASSIERFGRLVYDARDSVKSNICIEVQQQEEKDVVCMSSMSDSANIGSTIEKEGSSLRRRRVGEKGGQTVAVEERRPQKHVDMHNTFAAIPSAEVREAIRSFRLAADKAIELANIESKLRASIARKT